MPIVHADAFDYLPKLSPSDIPHIIYLDPMYPVKAKYKSLPKKDKTISRIFLPAPIDAKELVSFAQLYAREKVVLKRPPDAPKEENSINICRGKLVRFEVFPGKYNKSGPK